MNHKLYQYVRETLDEVAELPYSDARYVLVTALEILGKYSYLDLESFDDDIDDLDEEDEDFGE